MPAGTASFGQDGAGQLTAQLATFGLTPGSSHTVELLGPNGSGPLAQFGMLTSSAAGQGDVTLDSTYTGSVPDGSRLVILNGSQGDDVSNEPIAETSVLGGDVGGQTFTLKPVEVSPAGTSFGTPNGQATIAYDPGAQTLTVTVDASGLTPGNHAAHIHLGSCASQGAVQHMMMDLVANSQGNIVNETRVISGVTAPIPASGWYLNIHQGDSNTILQNGQPTIDFRPLLCADI
jgi:CHRD domain